MHISDLPDRSQDYLKTIWDITELLDDQPAALGDIAEKMNQKTPTASEAIKKLAARGLVNHEKYAGVTLTEQGKTLAIDMVRRHRLLETWLVQTLGYTWDEVHEEAERLEHVISKDLESRIAAALGHPTRDPHGEPIPSADLTMPADASTPLAALRPAQTATVQRVDAADPNLLRHLESIGLVPGAEIQAAAYSEFDHNLTVKIGKKSNVLGLSVTTKIFVDVRQ